MNPESVKDILLTSNERASSLLSSSLKPKNAVASHMSLNVSHMTTFKFTVSQLQSLLVKKKIMMYLLNEYLKVAIVKMCLPTNFY